MDLFSLLSKGKALLDAFNKGDWRTVADLAADLLKMVSVLLPSKPVTPVLPDGPAMLLAPNLDLQTIMEILALLRKIFGK